MSAWCGDSWSAEPSESTVRVRVKSALHEFFNPKSTGKN